MKIVDGIQEVNKRFNYYWVRIVALMWLFIFIYAGSYWGFSSRNQTTDKKNEPVITINFRNCPVSSENETLDTSALKTNIKKGKFDIILDTEQGAESKNIIPAIRTPKFIDLNSASKCIPPSAEVSIIKNGNVVHVYPKSILNLHQIVNDVIADENILITYSPFLDTVAAYAPTGTGSTFGVSGRLLDGDTLMFDEETESLWTQLNGEAVIGDRSNEKLSRVPIFETSFLDVISNYPAAQILSFDTGFIMDYSTDPYLAFKQSTQIKGKVRNDLGGIDPKTRVIAFELGKSQFAYRYDEFKKNDLLVSFVDKDLKIFFDEDLHMVSVNEVDENGFSIREVPSVVTYWYAWKNVYPSTKVGK